MVNSVLPQEQGLKSLGLHGQLGADQVLPILGAEVGGDTYFIKKKKKKDKPKKKPSPRKELGTQNKRSAARDPSALKTRPTVNHWGTSPSRHKAAFRERAVADGTARSPGALWTVDSSSGRKALWEGCSAFPALVPRL